MQRPIAQPLQVTAFLDGDFGITGGPSEPGRAYYTTDGGQTWTMAESSVSCLFGLDIVDAQTIWQCGLGLVSLSTDGGRTWQAVTDYDNCHQLSFLDARTGWIAASDRLGATADGGQTWQEVPLPASMQNIAAIALRTPVDGYLLDGAGVLHVTRDGGRSWSACPLGPESNTSPDRETASAAVRFVDADRGLVVLPHADGPISRVVALRTADGGQTWEMEEVALASPLITLYLSHNGATLTITDHLEERVTVLQYR